MTSSTEPGGPPPADTTPEAAPGTDGRFLPGIFFLLLAVGLAAVAVPLLPRHRPTPRAPGAERPKPTSSPALHDPRIEIVEARELFDAKEAVFLDVREPSEYEESHIAGAMSIPLDEIGKRQAEIPRGLAVLTYCACSDEETSAKAVQELHKYGIEAKALRGGVAAWRAAGLEMSTAAR